MLIFSEPQCLHFKNSERSYGNNNISRQQHKKWEIIISEYIAQKNMIHKIVFKLFNYSFLWFSNFLTIHFLRFIVKCFYLCVYNIFIFYLPRSLSASIRNVNKINENTIVSSTNFVGSFILLLIFFCFK